MQNIFVQFVLTKMSYDVKMCTHKYYLVNHRDNTLPLSVSLCQLKILIYKAQYKILC